MSVLTVLDVDKKRIAFWKKALLLAGMIILYSAQASADPSAGEPKRSYGAIDVIMYQTSW